MLTNAQLWKYVARPVVIGPDPAPPWLNKDQIAKFTNVQAEFNKKIAEIEAQKIVELGKIAGV